MQAKNGNFLRGGHTLFGVFVGQDGGTCGVKRGVVVGVVEVPVGVDDVFHRSVADAMEGFFELGPRGRNESIDDELAVGSVEDNNVSAGAGEQSEIVRELLRLDGHGAHAGTGGRDWIGCGGLLGIARNGRTEKASGKKLSQEGAAC